MPMNLHPDREAYLHMARSLQGLEVDEYFLTQAENLAFRLG